MFNIISKYFSFFNNKPPVGWVAHATRHFLTCYSYSYYSSMLFRVTIWSFLLNFSLFWKLGISFLLCFFGSRLLGYNEDLSLQNTTKLKKNQCTFVPKLKFVSICCIEKIETNNIENQICQIKQASQRRIQNPVKHLLFDPK